MNKVSYMTAAVRISGGLHATALSGGRRSSTAGESKVIAEMRVIAKERFGNYEWVWQGIDPWSREGEEIKTLLDAGKYKEALPLLSERCIDLHERPLGSPYADLFLMSAYNCASVKTGGKTRWQEKEIALAACDGYGHI